MTDPYSEIFKKYARKYPGDAKSAFAFNLLSEATSDAKKAAARSELSQVLQEHGDTMSPANKANIAAHISGLSFVEFVTGVEQAAATKIMTPPPTSSAPMAVKPAKVTAPIKAPAKPVHVAPVSKPAGLAATLTPEQTRTLLAKNAMRGFVGKKPLSESEFLAMLAKANRTFMNPATSDPAPDPKKHQAAVNTARNLFRARGGR